MVFPLWIKLQQRNPGKQVEESYPSLWGGSGACLTSEQDCEYSRRQECWPGQGFDVRAHFKSHPPLLFSDYVTRASCLPFEL